MMVHIKHAGSDDNYRLVDNEHYYSIYRKDGTEVATFGMGATLGNILEAVDEDYEEYKVELNSIARLQKIIRFEEGYGVSQATLAIQDLLATSYQLLVRFDLNKKLREDIVAFFDGAPEVHDWFYSRVKFTGDESDACQFYNGELYDYFSQILCPEGYYYGSTEGDGADIGFWQYYGDDQDEEGKDE